MITFHCLGFLHEINNGLGRNVCPNVGYVSEEVLNKISIVEEGTTTGIRIVVEWKCGPIANEISGPQSKPSTTANTPPDGCGCVISGLSPSFTGNVNSKESIQVIESRSEDIIGPYRGVVRPEESSEIR